MLFKIIRKSMQKKLGLLLAIGILAIISSLFLGLNIFTYKQLDYDFKQIKAEANPEDFRLFTIPSLDSEYDQALIDKIEKEKNVTIEKKIIKQTEIKGNQKVKIDVNKYTKATEVNKVTLEDGKLPENKGEIVVLPRFLTENNLQIGDKIEIAGSNYLITGTAYFIEYNLPVDLYGGNITFEANLAKFAPVYMNEQSYDELKASSQIGYMNGKYNDENLSGTEKAQILKEIKKEYTIDVPVMQPNGMPQLDQNFQLVTQKIELFVVGLAYEANPPISQIEREVSGKGQFFLYISEFLLVMTAMIAVVLVNSVFKSQRREMGILKAEGVSINKLSLGFLAYIAAVLGLFASIGLALSPKLSNILNGEYQKYFQLKFYPLDTNLYQEAFTTVAIALVGVLVLIYFISIRKNLAQKTLNLIKNIDSDKLPKRKSSRIFAKLNFYKRYQLNILFRNISKTFLLAFGVFASSLFILFAIVMYSAIQQVVSGTYSDVFTYEYMAILSPGKSIDEDKNSMIYSSAVIKDLEPKGDFSYDENNEKNFTVEAINFKENEFVHVETDDNRTLKDLASDEVIFAEGILKKYNLQIGDKITIQNPFDKNEDIELKIAGSTKSAVMPIAFMDLDYAQKIFGLDDNFANGEMGRGDGSEITKIDSDAMVIKSLDLAEQLKNQMAVVNITIGIVCFFALIISLISISTITSVIIESNRKTISVMKVLGYDDREVNTMTIGLYKWLVVLIYIISIPIVQYIITSLVTMATSSLDFSFDVELNYLNMALGIVVVYAAFLLSKAIAMRKIKKIKLSESLKADE
ncbi:MAG: FtsX-like permease family protein [Mycoplasmatales bacterium]